MSDFFKQLITQLAAVWHRLSIQQRIITSSLMGFTFLALFSLIIWSAGSSTEAGYKRLYSDLDIEEASLIVEMLDEEGYKYKIENNGATIFIESKSLYSARMMLAREGLPSSHGIGYELFDKTNLGVTDFVQKINARRALEGELQRTIEGLDEIKAARIHIAIPEPTIFLENQKEPKASVVIKMMPSRELSKEQVRGISHLVSNSIEGLNSDNISIVNFEGKLLTDPYSGDETAIASSRNMDLQMNIEKKLERKIDNIVSGILGPGKATVQVAADLDFDHVEQTMEKFDPESRVVRSEERTDENRKNAPDGDHQVERSLANYEIDKTIEHIIREVGNIKRLTLSVAVDGRYEKGDNGEDVYSPRTVEELANLEEIVKNAVGYDLARGDQIIVAGMKFDNEQMRKQQNEYVSMKRMSLILTGVKYASLLFVAILLIFLLRYFARTLAEAMNPPLPLVDVPEIKEEVAVDLPQDIQRSNDLLEKVELMTRQEPVNIATIIRDWVLEPAPNKNG